MKIETIDELINNYMNDNTIDRETKKGSLIFFMNELTKPASEVDEEMRKLQERAKLDVSIKDISDEIAIDRLRTSITNNEDLENTVRKK